MSLNLVDYILHLKYIKGCVVFQLGRLSLTGILYRKYLTIFLNFQLKPIAAKVNSHIKDTNDFFTKLQNLPKLPGDVILPNRQLNFQS